MTRAVRLSMPSPTADLERLVDQIFAAASPAASQSMQFNSGVLKQDLFDLECQYDPGETWPVDWIAFELAAWRAALSLQRLQLTFWRVGALMRRAFAGVTERVRPPEKLGATATVFDAEWNELDSGPLDEVMGRLSSTMAAKYALRVNTGTATVTGVVVGGRLCTPGPGGTEGVQLTRFCDQHPNGTDTNCAACAAARRQSEVGAS